MLTSNLPNRGDMPNLGVAATTFLYPLVGLGSDAPAIGQDVSCDKQKTALLVVDGPVNVALLQTIGRRQRQGCRSVVAPLELTPDDAARLAKAVDPTLTKVAIPAGHHVYGLEHLVFPLALVAPDPGLDGLCRARFSLPPASAKQVQPDVVVIVEGRADLLGLLGAIEEHSARASLAIVARRRDEVFAAAAAAGLSAPVYSEADAAWLTLLPDCQVAMVAGRGDDGAPTVRSALWALAALRAGVPVVTHAHPLLAKVADGVIFDDWSRALSLYLSASDFRIIDTVIGQARVGESHSLQAAVEAWRTALQTWGPSRSSVVEARPTLLTLLDLPQDLDVCLPILVAVRRAGRMRQRVVVTDWLQQEAPRTFDLLREQGFEPEIIRRKFAIAHTQPSFDGVDALLVPSATSLAPHRAGYGLTRIADAMGVVTFTLQHGFENVGLTYRDHSFAPEVRFSSRYVFTWGPKENLPAWTPVDTLRRVVPMGNPKAAATPMKPGASGPDLPPGDWSRAVGVFENLHWGRYDAEYIEAFLSSLAAVADARPDVLLLIKPHSAGRWSTKNADRIPRRSNIALLDPLDPHWLRFTAPDLIVRLDGVVTTPSTVAVDAARAGRPVAVVSDGAPSMGVYEPLPFIDRPETWLTFVDQLADRRDSLARNEMFLRRNFLTRAADAGIAEAIWRLTRSTREAPRSEVA